MRTKLLMRKICGGIVVLASLLPLLGSCCTTVLVTKGATHDASLLVAHSDDDELGDQRIVRVPAQDHPAGAKRAIYPGNTLYPRYVGEDRGGEYVLPDHPTTEPLGWIDQVPHTYAYIEANYGILNEKQLAIGECTNGTKFPLGPDAQKRLFDISALSRLALERCAGAREAILLMGQLAEKYGYYGEGETLLLADKNEGWVFEISPSPYGESALWVAKKVPDGEVFVAANQFRIQEIDRSSFDMLYSSNLFSIAKELKVYKRGTPLNWLDVVCPGEYDHPYYSLRRVWRIFDRIAPSKQLSPYVEGAFTKEYPFAVKPDRLLTHQDIMSLYRDHYEGTPFDQTKGLAAGPYGLPYRYLGPYDRCDDVSKREKPLEGAWERPISVYYTGYSYVTQVRDFLPDPIGGVSWIGFDEASHSCYMPVYIGNTEMPRSLSHGEPVGHEKGPAWRPFNLVSNWASLFYCYAIEEIEQAQRELEGALLQGQKRVEDKAFSLYKKDPERGLDYLTRYSNTQSEKVLSRWWELFDSLIVKYNEGFRLGRKGEEPIGYPKWWREKAGYAKGPIRYGKPSSK